MDSPTQLSEQLGPALLLVSVNKVLNEKAGHIYFQGLMSSYKLLEIYRLIQAYNIP